MYCIVHLLVLLNKLSGFVTMSISKTALVHESAFIDDEVEIGEGSKIWHFVHVLNNSKIGANCVLGQNVMVGPDVTIGRNCKIQNNVALYKGVNLADDVFCGPSCVFTNVLTPRAFVERKDEFKLTHVGKGATIGANATIVCGNNLGEYCMVAAGAVVTHDVPAYALVAGVPARRIGWVSREGERLDSSLICPRTGESYEENDGRLRLIER
jgi:UDP-2-acetamido-3-amino-2,3-dideoxy-glucuronate N-acetyltransferase